MTARLCAAAALAALLTSAAAAQSAPTPWSWERFGGITWLRPNYPLDGANGNFNGELDAAAFPGADIGAKIVAAAASCNNDCTVTYPPGAYAIVANVTIPAGVTLEPQRGAILEPSSGVTLTVQGPIIAPGVQIFGGAGSVAFTNDYALGAVDLLWWGADPSGTTDSTVALQAAFTAAQTLPGNVVIAPPGIYLGCGVQVGDPADKAISGQATVAPGDSLEGVGYSAVTFRATSSCTTWVLQRNNTSEKVYSGFSVDDNSVASASGADFSWLAGSPSTHDVFRDVYIKNGEGTGLDLDNQNDAIVTSVHAGMDAQSAVAVSIVAPTGQVSISGMVVNSGLLSVSAQSGSCLECTLLDGVEFPGSAYSSLFFSGGQIWANAVTGIAVDATGQVFQLMLSGELLSATGAGQYIFAGTWRSGAAVIGSMLSGATFGAISPQGGSGSVPQFIFLDDNLGTQPVATAGQESFSVLGSAGPTGAQLDDSLASSALQIGGQSGPFLSSGSAVPSGSCSNGSLYSNTAGASGSTLYACVAGAWVDVK